MKKNLKRNRLGKFFLAMGSLAAFGVFGAGFPAAVDGVITIDVAGNETYDVALPAATKLVKTGAGEATLTSDTTAFTGSVDVQEGTLKLTTLKAVGRNTKIEVTGRSR